MTTPRHHAREVALQILYRHDLAFGATKTNTPQELIKELSNHFEHFQISADVREFAGQLVAGTLTEITQLDSTLEGLAANWKVARMSSVDRSLLRMATYEMTHIQETDAAVVIDEAIELGKQFGTAETPSFINGILDALKTSLGRTR